MLAFSRPLDNSLRLNMFRKGILRFNRIHYASAEFNASGDFMTIGRYLATRMADARLSKFFAVPGDYNLVLLDELLNEPRMKMITSCNELNGGYSADGYARATGFSAIVVTYMVGGLSAINAVAGAYSDNLPLLVISGGPNSNERYGRILHHTIGERDSSQQSKCYAPVVADTFIVRNPDVAAVTIDRAVLTCLEKKKPVYLEIACNLAGYKIGAPNPLNMKPFQPFSDPLSLAAALTAAINKIENSVKPVLLAGNKLKCSDAESPFLELSAALGCAVAVMPDAKGLVPESNRAFMGTYWGAVSSPYCAEIVESSDLVIAAGPVFNDYTTTGWSTLMTPSKLLHAAPNHVVLNGQVFSNVQLPTFLTELSKHFAHKSPSGSGQKPMSLEAYKRVYTPTMTPHPAPGHEKLSLRELRRQIQGMLTHDMELVVETGDSWFNGQKLVLPDGAQYHCQMQYGSIGWSVGAALGVQLGVAPNRRVVALVGDGSFQMTAQEISVMIRENAPVIMFVFNNKGYTIEVEIHDGPYNNIKNWDYAGLVDVFNAHGEGNGLGITVKNGAELTAAIKRAKAHHHFVLIECVLDRDDCTAELLEWGSRVAKANSRPHVEH